MKTIATNNYVTVKELPQTREGLIHIPNINQLQKSFCGIITSVGEKIKNKTIVKDRVVFCNALGRIKINGVNFFKEDDILMSSYKGIWRPLGFKLLLKRLNTEIKLESGIVLPECYKTSDQTLHCEFILNGVDDNNIIDPGFDLIAGDVVRLKSWNNDIKEVEVDGNFFIIVKPSHILYKASDDDISNRIIS